MVLDSRLIKFNAYGAIPVQLRELLPRKIDAPLKLSISVR